MTFLPRTVTLATIVCLLAGCGDISVPSIESLPPVRPQPEAAHHVVFADESIRSNLRIDPSDATRDGMGNLDVQLNFHSVTDSDQYLVAFVTFKLDGQPVEKLGPERVVLGGDLHDTILFTSTQPADDYTVTFDFAK